MSVINFYLRNIGTDVKNFFKDYNTILSQYKNCLEELKHIQIPIYNTVNILTPPPTLKKNVKNLKKIKPEKFYSSKNDLYNHFLIIKYNTSKVL